MVLRNKMKRLMGLCGVAAGFVASAPLWYGSGGRCPVVTGGHTGLSAQAVPALARRYNADCTLCHTAWPRLNRTGYIYRQLGFRMPYEVDKEEKPSPTAPQAKSKGPLSVRQVFEKAGCTSCHAGGGNIINTQKPLKGPGFAKAYPDDASLANVIRQGTKGTAMPGYDESKISDEEMTSLIGYIRSLTPPSK